MDVYVEKKRHGKYNYLLTWCNPSDGYQHSDWFATLKDIKDYVSTWGANIINVNF